MKKIAMYSIFNGILIVFGCVLLVMACSTGDDNPIVEPDAYEAVEETDSYTESEDETESETESETGTESENESEENRESEGETDSENETENESETEDKTEEDESETVEEDNSMPNLIELINSEDQLSLFEAALSETDLADILMREGPYTVFAPTDTAVEQLFVLLGNDYDSFGDFDTIIEQQILEGILLGHVVEGRIASTDFVASNLPTLLPEDSIELILEGDTFFIRDASEIFTNFVSFNLEASNGTVHIIDKILIPKKAIALVE